MLALILWLGFRQGTISYKKEARLHGSSGWTFRRKVRLLIDSVTRFSHVPLRLMTVAGFMSSTAGFLYALDIVIGQIIAPAPVEGWASLMVACSGAESAQMMMLGVIGEVSVACLEESRRRPRYSIERALDRARNGAPPGQEMRRGGRSRCLRQAFGILWYFSPFSAYTSAKSHPGLGICARRI